MEVADVGPHLDQKRLDFGEIVGVGRFRIDLQIVHRDGNDLGRRVEDGDAAIGEILHHVRVEDHVEGIDRRVGHALLDRLDIVADAVGHLHVRHGMDIARVGIADQLLRLWIEFREIAELRLVQRHEGLGRDLVLQERKSGRIDHVITRPAGQKLGLQHLIAVIDVVDDLDAGLLLELRRRIGGDVVGPVVDVDDFFFLGLRGTGENTARQSNSSKSAQRFCVRNCVETKSSSVSAFPRRAETLQECRDHGCAHVISHCGGLRGVRPLQAGLPPA